MKTLLELLLVPVVYAPWFFAVGGIVYAMNQIPEDIGLIIGLSFCALFGFLVLKLLFAPSEGSQPSK